MTSCNISDCRSGRLCSQDFKVPGCNQIRIIRIYVNLPQETLKFYDKLWTQLGV